MYKIQLNAKLGGQFFYRYYKADSQFKAETIVADEHIKFIKQIKKDFPGLYKHSDIDFSFEITKE